MRLDNNRGCESVPSNEIEHLKMHLRDVQQNQLKYRNILLMKRVSDEYE